MKKYALLMIALLLSSWFWANAFDDAIQKALSIGSILEIDDEYYWVGDFIYESRDEALEDMSFTASLAVVGQLDWDETDDEANLDALNSIEGFMTYYYDSDETVFIMRIPMEDIIYEFTDPYYDDLEWPELNDEMYDYIDMFADEYEE